jgi:DNA replication protein DnaC
MLTQPLLDKLSLLRLSGLRQGLEEQAQSPHFAQLSFEDRLGLLIDREWIRRENTRLSRGLRLARFHTAACVEDLDLSPSRGIDRRLVLELAQCDWVRHQLNILVLGPTGAGKTYLACALGQAACRFGMSVRYLRTSRLLQDFAHAHADGSYPKLLDTLGRTSLLVIDDWLRDPITPAQARDLLEVLDDRYGRHSLLVVSQVPVAQWHERIPDPTIADALLDRLVHNAYRLEFAPGAESQRKLRSPLREAAP